MREMLESITSVRNPRVKHLVRLRESAHRRRQGRFPVEGRRELERALAAGWPLETLYFCPELFSEGVDTDLLEAAEDRGVEMVQMTAEPFRKAAFREHPDGFLAVAKAVNRALSDLPLGNPALLLVAAGVEKPGNLGALARTADAAGADALVVCDPVCDLFNPHAIRASQGSLFRLPVAAADTEAVIAWLEAAGVRIYATTPGAETDLWEGDYREPSAFILGAEATGLGAEWFSGGVSVRLPMRGLADSLNVSAMAAVALFEAVRQRRS